MKSLLSPLSHRPVNIQNWLCGFVQCLLDIVQSRKDNLCTIKLINLLSNSKYGRHNYICCSRRAFKNCAHLISIGKRRLIKNALRLIDRDYFMTHTFSFVTQKPLFNVWSSHGGNSTFINSSNSSSIDEIGNIGGGSAQTRGTAGRFPWQTCEREPALPAATNQHRHTKRNLSANTYLTEYLPRSDSQRGWEGQGSKFASKQQRKSAMIASKRRWRTTLIRKLMAKKPLWAPCMQVC